TKYSTPNTQYTKCYYDEMYKAGVTQTFTTSTNYGATFTGLPTSLSGKCADNNASHYTASLLSSTPTGTYTCYDYTYPGASSRNYGSSPPNGCNANVQYTSRVSGPSQWNTPTAGATGLMNPASSYVRHAMGASFAGPCETPVAWTASGPAAAASQTVNGSFTVGTATGNWQGMTSGDCTSSAPCQLYSIATTYTETDALKSWF